MKKARGFKTWIVDMEDVLARSGLLFFVMLILTVSLFFSLSRGGIAVILIGFLFFLVMIIIRRRQVRWPMVLTVFFLLFLFSSLTYLGVKPVLQEMQTLSASREDPSIKSRMKTWRHTWELIREFPVCGVGLGGFEQIYRRYERWRIWSYTHNDFLQLWAELGMGGIILLSLGLVLFLLGVIRWAKGKERLNSGFEAAEYMRLGCYTAMFCFLLHSLITFNFYIFANMMLFVVICGMTVRGQKGRKRPGPGHNHRAGFWRMSYGLLMGLILLLIVAALRGGYGRGGYKSVGDRNFREQVLKELPMARIMPLWNNSPYRYYFLARWYEEKGFAEENSGDEQRTNRQKAIREMYRALELQPARSLFWAKLGYLMSHVEEEEIGYRKAFGQALHFAPQDAGLHFFIGSYLWRLGDPLGLGVLQKAVNLNPSLARKCEKLFNISFH